MPGIPGISRKLAGKSFLKQYVDCSFELREAKLLKPKTKLRAAKNAD
jgi:hypothetical protein